MVDFLPVLMLLVFAILVAVVILVGSAALGPKVYAKNKLTTYECGVPLEDSARKPFQQKYYVIAVLFLLFDVEAAFFLPWALVYKKSLETGPGLLIAMGVFMSFVVLGLYYIIRKQYLRLA